MCIAKKKRKKHKPRRYLIDIVIPKTQYRLLLKIAEAFGLSLEELIMRSIQEYYMYYIVPVVASTTQVKR